MLPEIITFSYKSSIAEFFYFAILFFKHSEIIKKIFRETPMKGVSLKIRRENVYRPDDS